MTNKEIREKSIVELEALVLEMRQKLFALRFQNYNGQLETPSNIKETQKMIAKILTIIQEKHCTEVIDKIKNSVKNNEVVQDAKVVKSSKNKVEETNDEQSSKKVIKTKKPKSATNKKVKE